MEMSTLERHVMLLEVSTPQHRGLSCTWTCLENSSLCCSCTVLTYTADACASLGIVYTLCVALPGLVFITEFCAAPGWNSSILGQKLNQVLSVQQSSACAVPGLIYRNNTTETCSALVHVYTLGPEFTWTCLHYRFLCCTVTSFLSKLHLDASRLRSHVLHLEVSTLKGLSCTWMYLHFRCWVFYCRL